MSAKKGRPTDNRKNQLLQVRIDNETMEQLDYCAKKEKSNRSAIVRKGIKNQYDNLKK